MKTLVVLFLLVCVTSAMGSGYLFETVSSDGAIVRVKGMFSRYKLWPSTFSSVEQLCVDMGGMQYHAAMLADPHDWLSLHVEPPESGVVWGAATEFVLVTAAGETLYGGPVMLTDSPIEQEVFDARAHSVVLQSGGGPYGRNRLGYVVVVVGFPEGSLKAKHGEYWAKFDGLSELTVAERGREK